MPNPVQLSHVVQSHILLSSVQLTSLGPDTLAPWYRAGGAPTPTAVYQPKRQSTLADSYLRVAGSGGNVTLDPAIVGGLAPVFSTENGWMLDGIGMYLKSGVIQDGTKTTIIKYREVLIDNNGVIVGGRITGNNGMFIQPYYTNSVGYTNGSQILTAPQLTSGVLAIAGTIGYRNGVSDTAALTIASNTNTTRETYIGCLNNNGAAAIFKKAYVEAVAFYDVILTASQVLAISTALGNVGAYVGLGGLINNDASLGNVLQYEKTQAWSSGVTFSRNPTAPKIDMFFTNVSNGFGFPGYEFWINNTGKLHVRIINTITTNYIGVIGSTNVCDGKTHRAWATYDGSSTAAGVKIYLDGAAETLTVESDTLTGSIVHSGQDFHLTNQQGWEDQFYLDGWMRDFVLDNIVRDAAYVAANSNPNTRPNAEAGVRELLFLLDETSGIVASDGSGNNRNATLSDATMWKYI